MAVPGGYRAGGQLVVATLLATAVASCGASKPAGSPTTATSVNAPLVSRTTSPPHGAASSVVSFFIPSEAMAPTLRDGDHIAVEEIYAASAIHRGVIVVFKEPPNDIEPGMTDLVKRIIGLPGETIASRDGSVYINGAVLKEPWLPAGVTTSDFSPVQIPPRDYFVIGDNRGNSADSRIFGPIAGDLIVGVVVAITSPANRARTF